MTNFLLTKNDFDEYFSLLKLSFPLVFSNIVESSIGFVSTIFLSMLGQNALAAGSLVAWLYATIMVVIWGIITSVSVLVSYKYGEKDDASISQLLHDGMILAMLLAIPIFIILWILPYFLLFFGQNTPIVNLETLYLHSLALGVIPAVMMMVWLQFLIGLGHTRLSMLFMFASVPLNIFLNDVLVFGRFNFKAYGIAGIGLGASITSWIMTVAIIVYVFLARQYRRYLNFKCIISGPRFLNELLAVGVPMGGMYCCEVGFFLILILLMGLISHQGQAANQIALQYFGMLMAIASGLAQGVTVKMGHQLGEENALAAKQTAYRGIYMTAILMSLMVILNYAYPELLISIDFDIHDPKYAGLVRDAKSILAISAIFQVIEGMRIILFGSLRALRETKYTLISSIFGLWFIGLPIGYVLAMPFAFGSIGLWWGAVIGAACNMTMLFIYFIQGGKRHIWKN